VHPLRYLKFRRLAQPMGLNFRAAHLSRRVTGGDFKFAVFTGTVGTSSRGTCWAVGSAVRNTGPINSGAWGTTRAIFIL
jgi:hypothetical protein